MAPAAAHLHQTGGMSVPSESTPPDPRSPSPGWYADPSGQRPPANKAAFDPDSPFAALSSLKAALEKRSQE